MKHQEFYRKYKTRYPRTMSPWHVLWIAAAAVLIEPLIAYRSQRRLAFSFAYYLEQMEYFLFIAVPFGLYVFWAYWRESLKQRRGYCWVGKFEVVDKRSSFGYCQLVLSPGKENRLNVNKSFFNKTLIGDLIIIRRDALGEIDEV